MKSLGMYMIRKFKLDQDISNTKISNYDFCAIIKNLLKFKFSYVIHIQSEIHIKYFISNLLVP